MHPFLIRQIRLRQHVLNPRMTQRTRFRCHCSSLEYEHQNDLGSAPMFAKISSIKIHAVTAHSLSADNHVPSSPGQTSCASGFFWLTMTRSRKTCSRAYFKHAVTLSTPPKMASPPCGCCEMSATIWRLSTTTCPTWTASHRLDCCATSPVETMDRNSSPSPLTTTLFRSDPAPILFSMQSCPRSWRLSL